MADIASITSDVFAGWLYRSAEQKWCSSLKRKNSKNVRLAVRAFFGTACARVASVRLHRVSEVSLQRAAASVDDAKRNARRVHRGTHADLRLVMLQLTGAATEMFRS